MGTRCDKLAAKIKAQAATMDERDRLYNERSENLQRAIDKAEREQKEYNVRSNEFRGALKDAQDQMIPRSEARLEFGRLEQMVGSLRDVVSTLQASRDKGEGRDKGIGIVWGIVMAAAGLAAGYLMRRQ